MTHLVQINQLSKKIGNKQVLQNIDLTIAEGKIVGLLGSNGSGKTTLMKILAGLMHPSSGDCYVAGKRVGLATREDVSLMPDTFSVDRSMKVIEAIHFYRDFFAGFDMTKAKDMLSFMRLNEQDRIRALSKGMVERLALVLTLSRNARLYMLDEPIGGIDAVARDKILDALLDYYTPESTIILSTHLIYDIEKIFDEVIFIKQGSIVLQEEVEEIRLKRKTSVHDLFKEVYAEC